MVRTTARNIHALLVLDICDDWTIEVDCHDEAGDPLELLGAQSIEWKLTAADGSQVALLSLAGGDIIVKPGRPRGNPEQMHRASCPCAHRGAGTGRVHRSAARQDVRGHHDDAEHRAHRGEGGVAAPFGARAFAGPGKRHD
jgi:hypothetical protein